MQHILEATTFVCALVGLANLTLAVGLAASGDWEGAAISGVAVIVSAILPFQARWLAFRSRRQATRATGSQPSVRAGRT